jgi:hypothetical protein
LLKLDSLTVGPNTFSNVTILGANATDLFFTCNKGLKNVKLKHVSPDLQKRYNYDPNEAEKAEQQQIEDDARYQDSVASNIVERFSAAKAAREASAQAAYSGAGLADPVSDNSPIGKPVPALEPEKWIGGKPTLTGKYALLAVWSPKSVPCEKWIPTWNELNKKFGDKITMAGVTAATENDVAQSNAKMDFPCALDTDGKFIAAAGVTSVPCVLLLDPNGVIRYQGHPAAITPEVLQNIFKASE